ncbi:DUF3021 family protein [Liquorilactobacillus uvarum]|uniref:DUF3021 domain-containing protein n=1 Tax=Liquorilactobacillus uvarum DSM 19971 TaxID=1423812 RepID=A0A0R1Q8X6_9LACO|nr:DUF3021 family protein [Liquorilactobacillus uvarum]KRL38970.1 hypothetical protein FD20_GL000005 [Liquorilactobacillus uvarum DSM 19971]
MEWFKRIFNGLGIGSFVYMSLLLLHRINTVTANDVVFVFVLSCFVGITTVIFEIESLSFLSSLIIHYLGVLIFIVILNLIFGSYFNYLHMVANTTFIYIFSYIVVTIKFFFTTRQINVSLKQVRKKE